MSDNWMPILRTDGGSPNSLMVDLSHRDGGTFPDEAFPSATCVRVRFKQPGAHGLGDDDEARAIDEAFEQVEAALESADVAFVGRVRGDGTARYWLYSSISARPKVVAAAKAAMSSRSLEIEHKDDPSWSVYAAMLPTPKEERAMQDLMVVTQLQSHGDPLTPPRDVRHYSYFGDTASANAFAAEVQGHGFKAEVEESGDPKPGATMCVTASREDSVEPPGISDVTGLVAEIAARHRGTYDGWAAMVVKPKKRGLLARLLGR